MLFKERNATHMVEVLSIIDLINPNIDEVVGRFQEGEEQQDPQKFKKNNLIFLSGEELPRKIVWGPKLFGVRVKTQKNRVREQLF